MKRLLIYFIFSFIAFNAFALDLQQAKTQGLIGEANTGFVAATTAIPSKEVRQLIIMVNNQRNAKFKKIAVSHGLSVREVSHLAYKKAVEKTQAGHYYQNSSGRWIKK
ncbi:YdbL family protein [Photobacterium nomapromontoriensis]|uniref:YdbL family protein n=1 Tax=Photobacterium nomapromontoriensis TaxID=2910237 RepID=UPI003D1080FD